MSNMQDDAADSPDVSGDIQSEKTISLNAFMKVKQERNALKEKLTEFQLAEEDRKNSELSEIERLKKENTALLGKVNGFEIDQKKSEAFLKAKSAIGEGWTLKDESKVYNTIKKLSFDEATYMDDITEIVELAKTSKVSTPAISLGAIGNSVDKKPGEYTNSELRELEKTNPEKHKEVLAARAAARRK